MKNLTLENIAQVCGGTYYGSADKLQEEITSIITDSRKAENGCLFVPIVGERVDAHKFIPLVMAAGKHRETLIMNLVCRSLFSGFATKMRWQFLRWESVISEK